MRKIVMICLVMGLAMTGCKGEKEKESVPAPGVETLGVEAPAVPAPTVETPAVKAPAVETPAVKAPAVETPAVKAPAVETPAVKAPAVEIPVVKAPAVEIPVVKAPAVEIPAVKAPAVEIPAVKAPAVEIPVLPIPVVVPAEPVVPKPVQMGDAQAGAGKVGKCKACHSFKAGGRHKTGPNLFAVHGRVAGKADGFRKYGSDLKAATFTWDAASLAAWVCNSKAAIKTLTGNAGAKTKMSKQNKCANDALDIAAYLATLK